MPLFLELKEITEDNTFLYNKPVVISKKKAWAIARDDQVRKHSREAAVSLSRVVLSARRAGQSKRGTKTKKILVGASLLVASAALVFALAQKNSRKAS